MTAIGHDRRAGLQRQAPDPAPGRAERRRSARACPRGRRRRSLRARGSRGRCPSRPHRPRRDRRGRRRGAFSSPRLPALLEQLALGHVVDGAAHERADHEGVEEAAVVGGQDQRAAAGQVLAADALHAEVDQEERHEDRPERPVQEGVHAPREAALAKALQGSRCSCSVRVVLHALRYTAPDGAVTVGGQPQPPIAPE